jgi:hypothetical protein
LSLFAASLGVSRRFNANAASSPAPVGEIALFRALIKAVKQTPQITAEEFHGNPRQVWHIPVAALGMPEKRCELCDVLFVAFNQGAPTPVRITFLQAKYERHPSNVGSGRYRFSADMVQWSLLSSRPVIKSVRSFQPPPPPHLLAAALLPSVGSFGVFLKGKKAFEMRYHSADVLQTQPTPPRAGVKPGKLMAPTARLGRTVRGFREVVTADCMTCFAAGLLGMCVGTPVVWNGGADPIGRWLDDLLRLLGTPLATTARVALGSVPRPAASTAAVAAARTDSGEPPDGARYWPGEGVPRILLVQTPFGPDDWPNELELGNPDEYR